MPVGCRLGADSELSTLPEVVLRKIMQLALQPCTVQLYHVDSAFKLSILMAVTTDFLADMGGC